MIHRQHCDLLMVFDHYLGEIQKLEPQICYIEF